MRCRAAVRTAPSLGARSTLDFDFILRDLQRDGLVARRVYPTVPPSVDYRLTELGRSLIEPPAGLIRWAEERAEAIAAARQNFDAAA